jgi:hypothetical protein
MNKFIFSDGFRRFQKYQHWMLLFSNEKDLSETFGLVVKKFGLCAGEQSR